MTLSICAQAQDRDFVMPEPRGNLADIRTLASTFTFARIAYQESGVAPSVATAGGDERSSLPPGAWATDYPAADVQFSRQVEERLGLNAQQSAILRLTDPTLSQYPFVYLVEGGRLRLTDEEVPALRSYLLQGGFLMVDDFWGREEWASLALQLARVFPDRPIIELPANHEVFSSFYAITDRPSVPGLAEIAAGVVEDPHYRGILDGDGRLMVILLYNLDFGDAWEHVGNPEYPVDISLGMAIPMGINILVYALTH